MQDYCSAAGPGISIEQYCEGLLGFQFTISEQTSESFSFRPVEIIVNRITSGNINQLLAASGELVAIAHFLLYRLCELLNLRRRIDDVQ